MCSRNCRLSLLLLASVAAVTLGCGRGSQRPAIGGNVTFHNQPLDQGTITFLTTTGPSGPACGARIVRGHYEIPAVQSPSPGTYRVAISSPTASAPVSPQEYAQGKQSKAIEQIPARYNAKTTLTVELKLDGPTRFDFNLDGE